MNLEQQNALRLLLDEFNPSPYRIQPAILKSPAQSLREAADHAEAKENAYHILSDYLTSLTPPDTK